MISWRDMTFCTDSSICAQETCGRKWTDEVREQYRKACKNADFEWPVAQGSFKEHCGIFVKVNNTS